MNLWETRSSDDVSIFEMIHWMVGMGYDDTFNVLPSRKQKKASNKQQNWGLEPTLGPNPTMISAFFHARSAVRAPHRFRSRSLE